MCLHEPVQMTDEHRILLCADCNREFARLTRDEHESLLVPIETQQVILVVGADLEQPSVGFAVSYSEGHVMLNPVYPCAKCGFEGTCPQEGEECHT